MLWIVCGLTLLILSLIPAWLTFRNLKIFTRAASSMDADPLPVSVLIPARNEAAGIADTVGRVLSNAHPRFEVLILDDHSTDQTAEIVSSFCNVDPRVRLESSQDLPEGWNGKQFACWQLAQRANYDLFLFIDADVKVHTDCLQRVVSELRSRRVDLLSGFPRQQMVSFGERLLIPMMYYVLLGYLPLERMRATTRPEFGAGCGQLFLTPRSAYFGSGGHAKIRRSRHDGLKLPRCYRQAGLRTDVFDASDIASVRMYQGWREVIRGLLKNANEGIANSKLILIFTVLLVGGSLLPICLLIYALVNRWHQLGAWKGAATVMFAAATIASFLPPIWIRFRWQLQPLMAVFHPVSVAVFMSLQWLAFARDLIGVRPVPWRGRS